MDGVINPPSVSELTHETEQRTERAVSAVQVEDETKLQLEAWYRLLEAQEGHILAVLQEAAMHVISMTPREPIIERATQTYFAAYLAILSIARSAVEAVAAKAAGFETFAEFEAAQEVDEEEEEKEEEEEEEKEEEEEEEKPTSL